MKWIEGPEACDQLNDLIAMRGWTPLNSKTSRALVAYDDEGQVIGFSVVQLFPLLGPFLVLPEYRDGKLSKELADETYLFLQQVDTRGYLAICDSPVAERLCRKRGMKKIESPVYLG